MEKSLIAFIKYLDFDTETQLEEIDIDIFNEYRFKIYNSNGESSQNIDTNTKPNSKTNINKMGLLFVDSCLCSHHCDMIRPKLSEP